MKSGRKPKGQVLIKWSSKFAYAIGLLVSDGCLSKDGRHINLTSKDTEQLVAFNRCLEINQKLHTKRSGAGVTYQYVEFSDILFYQFLLEIGLFPAKSKTLGGILIPEKYFFDFLRGYFDGDGCSYSYFDPIFVKSFRFYISFASASEDYVEWLRLELKKHLDVRGFISRKKGTSNIQLKYSKKEAVIIAKSMYYHKDIICLERKKLKILHSLKYIK